MKRRVLVRYKVKPERIAEHEELIADVFAELDRTSPAGLRYRVFKQSDGVSFVHVAIVDVETNPLDKIAAFRAFTTGIKDRCDEQPVSNTYTDFAVYNF